MSPAADIVLRTADLRRYYALSRGPFASPLILKAVDGVSLALQAGKTLAVVGESGYDVGGSSC